MRNQPNRNYVSNDVVMTPRTLAVSLVSHLGIGGRVLEPCAGDGAFVDAIRSAGLAVESCEISAGSDFFQWTEQVDWIVTNPPWSQFRAFLAHSLLVADNVAMLATVNHWWTKRRVSDVVSSGFGYRRLVLCDWPDEFPASGFQLGMMHVMRGWRGELDIVDVRRSTCKGREAAA